MISHLEIAKEKHFERLDVGNEVFLFFCYFSLEFSGMQEKEPLDLFIIL
ncbi:hypothetical protein RV08_GL003036 [Enterococcus mundtii]|nr:hypothetical protein RV08_GL003036 [Enterococcus mundtii]